MWTGCLEPVWLSDVAVGKPGSCFSKVIPSYMTSRKASVIVVEGWNVPIHFSKSHQRQSVVLELKHATDGQTNMAKLIGVFL